MKTYIVCLENEMFFGAMKFAEYLQDMEFKTPTDIFEELKKWPKYDGSNAEVFTLEDFHEWLNDQEYINFITCSVYVHDQNYRNKVQLIDQYTEWWNSDNPEEIELHTPDVFKSIVLS